MPGAIFGQKRSSRDNVMDMVMILEGASPCVKDTEEAGKIASEMSCVGNKLPDGFGGCLEQRRIGRPLVAPNESAQTLGNGEGHHEMMAG